MATDQKHSSSGSSNRFISIITFFTLSAVIIIYTTSYKPVDFLQELSNAKELIQNVSEAAFVEKTPSNFSKFRQNYKLWDKIPPILNDEPAKHRRNYFVYECTKFCCGWADQMKGTMLAYIVANLTGRTFKARYLNPACETLDYVRPNKIDWYLEPDFKPPKNECKYINHIGDSRLKKNIRTTNFTEYFHLKERYYFFKANLQYFKGLKETTVYKDELSWMKDLTPADIYGAVFKQLFKLPPRLLSTLENVLDEALPTRNHRLICIHVRLGGEAFRGEPRRNSMRNMPKIWSWISNQSRTDNDKVFVTSDSDKVIESARQQSFGKRLISFPGTILHSNKMTGLTNMAVICNGMKRLMLEVHMLMNCDVLVRGHSGVSVISSVVRGTDEDLYCLSDNGDINKCERNKFNPEFLK